MLRRLSVSGRLLIWIIVGKGPIALAFGADGGSLLLLAVPRRHFCFVFS